jgi:ribosomal protein S18 acetylase RimI-like enzyme
MTQGRIRKARKEDVGCAILLLLDAGTRLIIDVFGDGNRELALSYLSFAWQLGAGQYGYENHWVCEMDGKPVGLVTCWHNKLPANFDRDTLTSVSEYYGLDVAIEVVMRSQSYLAALETPMATELGIGHLAVHPDFQRRGVACQLVLEMENEARRMKKNALVLNVEEDNLTALAFYKKRGFGTHRRFSPFIQMIKAVSFFPKAQ